MKKAIYLLFPALAVLMTACVNKGDKETLTTPPAWAAEVIWYQIFVERFNNGDPSNDPTLESISTPTASFPVPDDWSITPWTSDWYKQEPWAAKTGRELRETLQHRRYGGDLQGILDKLDYLEELGITAIYLNPINDAPSLHKFDARNYHHIDINFGPDPEGDLTIMATEDPADPSTWKWTSADKLFLKLIDELHKRGIKVIVDYSWNHTGVLFWAWKDLVKKQEESDYSNWYEITSWDNPSTKENEFSYKGWLNIMSLPELRKTGVTTERINGRPYEGNINEYAREHIFNVTRRWLAPDGNVSKGIDGFRLDVADQIPMGFWKEYHTYVKSINPLAYLVGEIWWETWPHDFMDPAPYANDSVFDAVMFYHAYRPARGFFANGEPTFDAAAFAQSLQYEWDRLGEPFRYGMMNVNATHDTPRLLSCFANKGRYKYHASPYEDTAYISGRPDEDTYNRVRMYLAHQFTSIGAPGIWNGDEFGMWGGDDPDERKPLWWKEFDFDDETRTNIQPGTKSFDRVGFNQDHFDYYRKLIRMRKENPVLIHGKLDWLAADGNFLAYKRYDNNSLIVAAFNTGSGTGQLELPFDGIWIDLLNGAEYRGSSINAMPLQTFILKLKKK